MPIWRYWFQVIWWLFMPILLRMTAMMRGTEPIGPPECHSTEWSTDRGCSLEPTLLRVVTTSGWIASNDLFDCRLTWWSTVEADCLMRIDFEQVSKRPGALIPDVGNERPSVRKCKQRLLLEEPYARVTQDKQNERERESEWERNKVVMSYYKYQQLQKQ